MKMIRFEEEDIKFLALELPDSVKHYHYSADFDAEIREIDKILSGNVPEALQKRLILERVIAEGMKNDYHTDFSTLLSRLKTRFPNIKEHTLDALVQLGGVDYILKGGEYRFQNSALSNILATRTALLETLDENGYFHTPAVQKYSGQHINAALMAEKGGRAFQYTVTMGITLKRDQVREGQEITVHLPYPAICDEQPCTELLDSSHPVEISSSDHRTASIKTVVGKDEKFFVTFRYVNKARYTRLSPEAVCAEQPDFFTEEKLPQIRFSPLMKELAREICKSETNPLLKAKKIYDYLTGYFHYSYMREYLYIADIPEFAILNRRGDCGVQAIVFVTLCRIMGIPARWQSGCTVDPDDGIGSHDWAQIYIAPYGWIPVDLSYGTGAQRRGDKEMRDYFFGNISPFRMITCNDIQVPFSPPKKYLRMDPYDNQIGEAEYSDYGLGFGEFESNRILISAEDVTNEYFKENE